jgi:hypothetical protein
MARLMRFSVANDADCAASVLKERATPFISMRAVRLADASGKGVRPVGQDDEMNMVGHQAPGKNIEFKTFRLLPNISNVILPIFIVAEYGEGADAPLCDVVGVAWNDGSGHSWHGGILLWRGGKSNK